MDEYKLPNFLRDKAHVYAEQRWTSNAEWPCQSEPTTDEHDTREQAQAVCTALERNGMGGEREIFPLRTWVAPVMPNVKVSGLAP